MSGLKHFLLSLCTIGFMVCSSRAWWVDMPRSIKALWGSCVVIPCSYDYYRYPPVRHRVVWYKYQTHGYPLVYDSLYPRSVTDEFREKTSLYNPSYKSCSLHINPVTMDHDGEEIYPWVDPENIGSSTHRFFDKTVRIDVVDTGESPRITFSGSMKVGQQVQVECSVGHTCPAISPNMKWNIRVQSQSISHSSMSDGTVRSTLKSTYIIERTHQTVECTIVHRGGKTARTSKILNAECSISPLTISPTSYEFLEGQTRTVTCTASYTCSQHRPTLTWNYGNMPESTITEQNTNTQWTTVSTLSFTASANDHGKSLTCYARGGQTQDKSITLHVKKTTNLQISLTTPRHNPGTDPTIGILPDEIWERTVKRTWTVQEDDYSVNCTDQKAMREVGLNAEYPYHNITMVDPPAEATEGVATSVICSVTYKCKKNEPTIVWNFENMQSSSYTEKLLNSTYKTVSNLTFIGSLGDDGKPLTCTAKFKTGETSDSTTLHIKEYEPDDSIYPHDPNMYHIVDGAVPVRFTALTRSCVVIPCSFQYHEDVAFTRGVWSKRTGGIMYHNNHSMVHEHFKGRTRLIGDLNEGNCSVEIDDIKPFDNGPFCFHLNRDDDRYKFTKSCVFVVMKASPDKPVMTQVPAEVDAGSTISVSCSVPHTCQSHPPDFSWSVPSLTNEVTHTSSTEGIWNTTSTITFMVEGGDGDRNLTCTATFWRGKQQASTVKMNVKGTLRHQLISSLPVSIPVTVLVLIVIILGAMFGVFMWKGRRSIWNLFSRNQGNTTNLSMGYVSTTTTVNSDPAFTPHCPSPKDNQRQPPEDYPLCDNM